MREIDYTRATDLAKLRLAEIAIRDTLPMFHSEDCLQRQRDILIHLSIWIKRLENKIDIEGEQDV